MTKGADIREAAAKPGVIATLTMNPSIDQHIFIDRLVKEDAIRARDIRRDPGGKGINVSRVLRELGAPTVAFGICGGGAGYMVKSLLRGRGIPFQSIEVADETRINFILTDRSDRTQTRISAPGPWVSLEEADRVVELITSLEPPPAWWALGGSLPRGIPTDFYARVVRALGVRGARCFIDADDDVLKIGIEAKPYGIKPNDYELARLVGRELRGDAAILDAAHEVLACGVTVVAVSLGADGALVVTDDEAVRARVPQVEVLSKVGAGDSFLAGLILALSRGDSLQRATRFASAAGTAAVMFEGTHLCRREDVSRLEPLVAIEVMQYAARRERSEAPPLAHDVVCGGAFDPELVSFSASHGGREYRFCSLLCRTKFLEAPSRYVDAPSRATAD
jgi:1-phosphofructokinase family hexose kinase